MTVSTTHSLLSAAWTVSAPASVGEPPATRLALPAADGGLRYAWHSWVAGLINLLTRRELRPQRTRRYRAHFRLSDELRQRWHAFFEHSARRTADAPCAFTYSHSVARLIYARLFADLGVDARRLVHLRHQTWLPLGAAAHGAAQSQQLEARLKRAVRIGHDTVLLALETEVSDGAGNVVARVEDGFVARRLGVEEVVLAEDDAVLRRAIARLRRRGAELDEQESGVRCTRWRIGADAVRGFGGIAGDTNPLPGARWAAAVFGGRRPVVQAGHLRNLVARELSRWGLAVTRLSITFVGRARAGQTMRLLSLDDRFEVCDDSGRLVAFGKI